MKNKRYETCKFCKNVYNVSILAKIPQFGYICPRCRARARFSISGKDRVQYEQTPIMARR